MKTTILTTLLTVCLLQISFAQDYRFGKVSKEELQQKAHPQDPAANAAVLYREIATHFLYTEEEGFYIETEVYERIKIYTKEGFSWATKVVRLYQSDNNEDETVSGLKAYTYNLQGNDIKEEKLRNDGIFEQEEHKYLKTLKFTMPDLKEGSVVEYRYKIKSPFITNIDEYRFQEQIPVEKVFVKFVAPEYFNYKMHQKGWMNFAINTDMKDRTMSYSYKPSAGSGSARDLIDSHKSVRTEITFKENIYTIDLENVPALREEKRAGNIDNYSAALKFELSYIQYPNSPIKTYSTTWEDVSKTIHRYNSFGDELATDNYFKDDIDQLLSGVTNKEEKILKIFEFVKSKMNWNGYHGMFANEGVKKAYKSSTGNVADINLMLTAMLRYAGVNANPILVSTKSNGIPLFPTMNGFNYVIAGVEVQNNVLLLDATNKRGEIGLLEPKLLNWQGRLIRQDGSSNWVPLSPREHAVNNTMLQGTIAEDLSIAGNAQNRFTGHYALEYREQFSGISDDEKRKKIENGKGELETSAIAFNNLNILYEPVELTYEFESFDAVENINGKLYVSPLLFLTEAENPFKAEERQYPIDFQYPFKDRYLISLDIPEGYQVEVLPEPVTFALDGNACSFRYAASASGNKIQVSVELSMNEALFLPTDYVNLKKFYQMLIDKENEKIVLSKT
ncbi:DUF3857 domain-containing protein [Altibacter sp.]|uniref:DUF3857 domain-containing protein n=1 Tax=Altibacter sp. TaxID=2024823 RepID=UPI000C8C0B45|nr:DUF3857 domain-containing protein [Altibacter sp.]MAP55924.1 transglutaminase [Altibacter sp.]